MDQIATSRPTTPAVVEFLIYLYGFVRVGRGLALPGIEIAAYGNVAAAFARVPAADWGAAARQANVADSAWLIDRAWRHELAVEALSAGSPILPVRFGALFSSVATLEQFLARHATEISDFLDRIDGHEEWSLKSYLQADATEAWLLENDPEVAGRRRSFSPEPGKRYFEEKRLQGLVAQLARELGQEAAADVHERLRLLAVSVQPLRLQAGAAQKRAMIRHEAWLLRAGAVDEFRARVGDLQSRYAGQGLILETAGPWPPYSFCPLLTEDGR